MTEKRKNLIITPFTVSSALNQEALLANAEVLDADILIVNDGRPDGELAITTGERIMYLKHENPLGIGAMMANAIRLALDLDYSHIVFVGGRIESSRRAAEAMLNALATHDVVTCSRFMLPSDDAASARVNELTGYALTDMFSPYIAFGETAMKTIDIEEFDNAAYVEIIIQSAHCGLRVKEISEESIVTREKPVHLTGINRLLLFIETEVILYPITKNVH